MPRARKGDGGRYYLIGTELHFGMKKKFCRRTVVINHNSMDVLMLLNHILKIVNMVKIVIVLLNANNHFKS